jgi:hypothetical protein
LDEPSITHTPTTTIESPPSFLLLIVTLELSIKVRKTQHQNPEFGHTQGEIQKNLQKSTLASTGDET